MYQITTPLPSPAIETTATGRLTHFDHRRRILTYLPVLALPSLGRALAILFLFRLETSA